jgi:hypothetical protein
MHGRYAMQSELWTWAAVLEGCAGERAWRNADALIGSLADTGQSLTCPQESYTTQACR